MKPVTALLVLLSTYGDKPQDALSMLSCLTLNPMLMQKVECLQHGLRIGERRGDDHDMHDLVTCPEKVKPPGEPLLGELLTTSPLRCQPATPNPFI